MAEEERETAADVPAVVVDDPRREVTVLLKKPHRHRGVLFLAGQSLEVATSKLAWLRQRGVID